MAPLKRKATTDERPSKKAKSTDSAIKAKSSKPERPQKEDSGDRKPVPKSLLQQEEKAFPRGGASVLTPLEHKQIKAQAERDVLFEQQTGQTSRAEDEDGELLPEDESTRPLKKRQKKQRHSQEFVKQVDKPTVKIQSLSYRNLVVGAVVLGHVTAITDRDIALALADNLTGYVPITSISERLNNRIETLLEDDGPDTAANGEDVDVDLKKLFYLGQWLRASVTATTSDAEDSTGKNKRHIELSIDPRQANSGLTSDTVVVNSMIQASVRSAEDHGIVMDPGLSNTGISGFVSKKELGAAFKLNEVQEGQVMMCLVTGKASNGKVLKMSPDAARFSILTGAKDAPCVKEAPSVAAFQPGTAVEVLITEPGVGGVAGKVMGMLDVTADIVHAGLGTSNEDLSKKLKIGSKVKGRILWSTPSDDGSRRIGVSLLDHMLALSPPPSKLHEGAYAKSKARAAELQQAVPNSAFIEEATVKHVQPERGLFITFPGPSGASLHAFVHISQISDNRIENLSSSTGPYKLDTVHRARVLSYNPIDGLYYVCLKKSILDQPFLRIEDLVVGEMVKGTVERLILGRKGINGVLVKLSESINALVPDIHLSDVHLQHPERRFKEGYPVRGRVLNVDLDKRYVRLTLKKSLASEDDDAHIWKDYSQLKPGMEGKGTVVNLLPNGAAVQFFGNVRAWLPVAEMSETYIESPQRYFRLGQTVNVTVLSVDPESHEMKVSCKGSGAFETEQQEAWDAVSAGELVSATISAKSAESVTVDLDSGLKGTVRIGHLRDGSSEQVEKALSKIHLGQQLSNLLILDKLERSHHLLLTKKPSMIEDMASQALILNIDQIKDGMKVRGFVRNITEDAVFVEFGNGIVGFMSKSQLPQSSVVLPSFGLTKDESISAWVMSVDAGKERFTLTMREPEEKTTRTKAFQNDIAVAATNSIDPSVSSTADFTLGKVTKARIASVKATQINVRLADNVQGRIDVSEVFDSWDNVTNKKAPLQKFQADEVLEVKILGIHDARNHRFLPISHRQSSVPVFELSSKRSRIEKQDELGLTMDSVKAGSSHMAFVNNHEDHCIWVNISPNVRGRVALMDLSDDVGQLQNLPKHFPIGSALRVSVKNINASLNRLDLVAKYARSDEALTLESISPGMVLAGRVTRITERAVNVQLADHLAGSVPLVELGDDFDNLNIGQYHKNDIVRACVLDLDLPNKRIFLSLRPSRVLSSSLPVQDPQVTSYSQLKVGSVVRGFVKHVADKGVYVALGARIDAFVRITDLSDKYVKDWKTIVEIDQLVKGRVVSVDTDGKSALLSLKASHTDENYVPPININDLKIGMVVTGKVRKVEDFGAFIDLDNTQPRLSGLCHRSEIAAKRIQDVRKIYAEGDVVKAKVLNVDVGARKISLGLKASYFADEVEDDGDSDEEDDGGRAMELDNVAPPGENGGVELQAIDFDDDFDMDDLQEEDGESEADAADLDNEEEPILNGGLKTSGFDWTGESLQPSANGGASDSEQEVAESKKRKRHKPEIKVDLTGELDRYGPRSVNDFERLLLGQPNDSALWTQYMAFQLQLSEVQKARELAERALRTIHIRETEEKANIWIAWLNLEVEYGDDERVEEVFRQACQMQDSLEMHERLASIYIDSGKYDKADAIFERIVGNKSFRASPDVWFNYATFLMETLEAPARARALLSKSLQSIPTNEHRLLTAKFAGLEFRSAHGDAERGRTIFEGLVAEWPKWTSGWDMFCDLERSRIGNAASDEAKGEAKEKVRALFERMTSQKMKKRRAKFVFKRWLEFEEMEGNDKTAARVKALATEFVERQKAAAAAAEEDSED